MKNLRAARQRPSQEVLLPDGTPTYPLRMRRVRKEGEKPNKYCGPAVLSSLTSMTTCEAARLFTHVTGRKRITGTSAFEMDKAMALCGMTLVRQDTSLARKWLRGNWPGQQHLTLAAWFMYTMAHRRQGDIYLISAGNHWQLVECNQFVCGQVVDVVGLRHKGVHRRSRLKGVWKIRCGPSGYVAVPEQARPRKGDSR